jgi:hypothetical protein
MKEKIYNIIMELNCYFCVLAAILTVTNSPIGSFVFVYTSTVGLVDSIKNKIRSGIIINSTFLAMNTYFSILTIIGLF